MNTFVQRTLWLDSILYWREPRTAEKARLKKTPLAKRFGRLALWSFLLALALTLSMALLLWRGDDGPLVFIQVVLFITVMWTVFFLGVHWMSSMLSVFYIRITDEKIVRDSGSSNATQHWRFDQVSAFKLATKQESGLGWRCLELTLLSGENVCLTIAEKVSDDQIRKALEGKLIEMPNA
jgi:hypothetical protein